MSVGQLFNRFVAVWFIALLTSAAAMAQPVFNAVVSPGTVGAGNLSTLTYTIDNSGSASTALDATFSTTLPAGMTFQGDPEVDTDCIGAVVSAPSGGTTLSFSDADITAGSLCQIVLNVAASSSGTITSGDLTSILGNSGPTSTTLTVNAEQVTFDKSFSPASVSLGGKSTLTFTITNPSASVRVGNLDLVDTLPVGMEVASPANATTDCISLSASDTTLTAVAGSGSIQLDANGFNGFAGFEVLPVSSSCTVTVDVKATAGGDLVNSASLQADFVDVGSAQDTLSVTVAALNLAKSFLINPANAGGTTELEFTINNFNRFDSATGVAFSDDLDAALSGLTYDSLLSNTCGGTVGGTGTSTISFSGGTVPAADLCKIKVALAVPGGAVGGSYPNTTSTITGTVGAVPVTGNAATDTLIIPSGGSAPTLAFEILEDGTFAADPVISAGDDIVLRYTITNTSTTDAASDVGVLLDPIPPLSFPLTATLPAAPCGAGSSIGFVFPGTEDQGIELTGGSLAIGASCTFDVVLTTPGDLSGGTYTLVTEPVTATLAGGSVTGLNDSDSFVVGAGADVVFNKTFASSAVPGGTVSLTFDIVTGAESAAVSALSFTDDLNAMLTGATATGLPISACGGTLSGSAGNTLLTFTGGALAGAGDSCTIPVTLNIPASAAVGTYTNTTSDLSGSVSGTVFNFGSASDDLSVAGLNFTKEFVDTPVIAGETTTLRFSIENVHPTDDATITVFTDNLAANLSGLAATGPVSTDTCGGSLSGTTFLIYTGGSVLSGQTCIIEVEVLVPASAPDGSYANVTSSLSANMGGAITADPATATLEVQSNLITLTKSFTDGPVSPGGAVTLEFTLTNEDATRAASAIAFSDNLDAMLSGTIIDSVLSNSCGGSFSGTGTDTFNVSGVALASGASCTITTSLTIPGTAALGTVVNTTSDVTATIGGFNVIGDAASDTLEVAAVVDLMFSKSFADVGVPAGGSTVLSLSVVNTGSGTVSGISFTDDLDAMLSGTVATGHAASAGCGGGGTFSGSGFLTASGYSVAVGQTCTLTATVTVPGGAGLGNYSNTTSQLFVSGVPTASAASDTLVVVPAPTFSKDFADPTIAAGFATTMTLTVDNSAAIIGASSLDVTDNLPAGMVVAATPNASTTCTGGTLTATSGSGTVSYSGGAVAASASCIIAVDVTAATAGALVNTTGDLTSSLGNSGSASDTLTVVPQPAFTKAFSPASISLGQSSTLTFTIDNTGSGLAATSISFIDTLPANLVVAPTPNASTTCTGGTLSATGGAGTLSYTSGSLAGASSCTVNVDVVPTAAGALNNLTGDLTSSLGNSGPASATLTVISPEIDISGSVGGAVADGGTLTQGTLDAGVQQTLTLTISNTGSDVLTLAPSPVFFGLTNVVVDSVTGPLSTSVAIGSSTTVTILYTPAAAIQTDPTISQPFSFNLSLGSNDVDEAVYDIQVGGTAQDATAPAGYTAAFDQDPVNGANQAGVSFTFAAAEVGADFAYSIASDGGGAAITGTGTIVTATDQVTGIDVSALGDGTLTLTVALTDVPGNTGPNATDTTTKDATAPAGYTAAFDQDPVNGANQTGVSFTFAGAEVGAGFAYSIASDGGGAAITGTGTIATATDQVTGIDVSALGDGTLTLTVALTDVPGNTGANATDTTTKDATAPAGYSVSFDQDPVNGANQAAMSFTFAGAEVGAGYAYSIASDGGGAAVTGTGTIATITDVIGGLDLSGLSDGTLTLTVTLTDVAGNTGVEATDTVGKDTVAPALAINTPLAGDGLISAAEASAVIVSGTSTDLADGATVNIAVADGAAGSVTGTATVTGGVWTTTLNLSALADGALALTADAVDAASNPAPQATATATLDTVAPTGYTAAFDQDPVNLSNQTAIDITVSGAEVGATVALRIESDGGASLVTPGTVAAATATVNVTGLDLSSLDDGTLTVSAILIDPAGNAGAVVTGTATKDTDAPSLAIDSPLAGDDVINAAEAAAVTVSGTSTGLADGAVVTVNATDTGVGLATGTATVAGGVWTLSLDVTGLADGALNLTANASDAGGNPAPQATATATKDAVVPVVTIDGPIAVDDVVNGAEAASTVISGTSTDLLDGAMVNVSVSDAAAGLVTGVATVTGGAWSVSLDLTSLADGALGLTADASDAAGNPAPQAIASVSKDVVAPAGYSATLDQNPINGGNQAAVSFTFAGAEVGASFAYTISSDGGGTPVSGAGTIVSATDQISGLDLSPLSDGTVTLSVALTDPAGNTGANATDTKLKDVAVPTATLAGPITPQADPFIATLTFSEVVTGLDLTSVALVNGTASGLTGSGTDYSFTVTPDHDGTVEIALDAGAAADAAGNLSDAATAINVTTDLTGTPNPTPLPDADGDGVADTLETGDRDGDGIPDDQDFDPQGYYYCEDDGRIIPGGGFTVSGPSGSNGSLGTLNDINITRDGTTGEIQWFALRPGTYSMSLSYPTAVGIPSTARLSSGTLDLTTLLPANPAVIGSSESGATGFLADTSIAANPAFYTSFVIEPGDPFVLSNNIPMTQCAENLVTVTASTDGAEANAGAPTDATFTITQGRVSTVDTVISYTVAGSATSGTDFTALSGTVTIPAGATSATITVPVLEDGEIEGPETVEITLTGVTAGDLTTVLGTTVTRSANIADDDFADIAVVNVDLVTNEGGGDDATMTFALLGTPTSPVTLRFAGDSQCSVSPASMTFTSADYAVPQALTIRAIDDDKVEGTHSCQPTVVVSSGDTRYDGAPLALATVTVADDLVDQIREPLTEILEDDLKETITTQTKAFSRMAKGALQRLQAGRDLHCGTIEGFDVDGSVQVQDGTGAARGTFGRDAYNCVTDTREILDGTFSLNKTEDTGVQALLQFAWQRERFISDEALSGYFLGGYYSRTDVSGLGDGSIDGFGVNGGLYGARSFAEGLFLDYYVAGAAGRHTFDIDFDAAAAPINATGQYSYLAGFAGVGVSGERAFDSFVMKPRVGLDLSYAKAGDADVTATQLGLSHDGVIDLDDFSGVRATAEIRFESLAAPGGAEALAGMMRTAFTPRFVCELSSYDDATNCGVGLAFAWERTDAASGLTWGLEVDVEQIDDNRRFTFNIKRERPVANGRGAIVTRLSMPEAETLQLEHGLKLDF
ncbi:MAG: hypothetical protein CMF72_12835 [Mameliella sp.]|nr:hypothetical protein [Mameliella sp.]